MKTILVVDDEKEIANLIVIFIQNEGFQTKQAMSETEARKKITYFKEFSLSITNQNS